MFQNDTYVPSRSVFLFVLFVWIISKSIRRYKIYARAFAQCCTQSPRLMIFACFGLYFCFSAFDILNAAGASVCAGSPCPHGLYGPQGLKNSISNKCLSDLFVLVPLILFCVAGMLVSSSCSMCSTGTFSSIAGRIGRKLWVRLQKPGWLRFVEGIIKNENRRAC